MSTGQEVHPDLVTTDAREWIVVDGAGGSAHGSVAGWPLRRPHAWLHATRSSGEVVTTLLGLEERLRTDTGVHDLAPVLTGEASVEQARFEHFSPQPWPTWRYRAGDVVVERSLFMIQGHHAVVVGYRHVSGGTARLRLSPLIVARDPDAILRESPDLQGLAQDIPGRVRIQITPSIRRSPSGTRVGSSPIACGAAASPTASSRARARRTRSSPGTSTSTSPPARPR